jgi:hypothetical protein
VESAGAAAVVAQVVGRRHREGVLEPREGPPLLHLADEDGDHELVLLGELGRHDVRVSTVGRLKVVVDDMIDHVVRVTADHSAVVDLVGDLAAGHAWSSG